MVKVNIFVAVLVYVLPLVESCENGTYMFNNTCYEPKFERPTTFSVASQICDQDKRRVAVSNDQTREFLYRLALKIKFDNFWVGNFNDCYALKYVREFNPEKESCEENFFYICEFSNQQTRKMCKCVECILLFDEIPFEDSSSAPWKCGNKYLELCMNSTTYKNAAESCSSRGGKLADVDTDEKRKCVEKIIYENTNWWIEIGPSTLKELHSIHQTFWAGITRSECWKDSQGIIVKSCAETIDTAECAINDNGYIRFVNCEDNYNFFCEYFPAEIGTEFRDNPETGKPGIDHPETGKPGIDNPETGKREMDNPETVRPETGKREMDNPETDKPDVDYPETDKPDVDNPETGKPEVDNPETDKPDVDKPENSSKWKPYYYLVPIGISIPCVIIAIFIYRRNHATRMGNADEDEDEAKGLVLPA